MKTKQFRRNCGKDVNFGEKEGSQYNTISQYNTEISVNLKNVSSGSWKRRLDSRMLWQESGRLSR